MKIFEDCIKCSAVSLMAGKFFKNKIFPVSKGFTLIELLVVISIIGLLSSIVLAALQGARQKSVTAAALQFDSNTYQSSGDHIVGDWEFIDGSSLTLSDSSLNGNNGTLVSGPVWNKGNTPTGTGYSLSFNGSQYVSLGTPTNLGLYGNQPYTLSAWVNPSATVIDGAIVSYGGASGNRVISISYSDSLGTIKSVHYSNDHIYSYKVPFNTWTLLTITYDGTTEKLYANGIFQSSWNPSPLSLASGDPMYIGRASWNGAYMAQGFVSEVRIYNEALTAYSVNTLYALSVARYNIALKQNTIAI